MQNSKLADIGPIRLEYECNIKLAQWLFFFLSLSSSRAYAMCPNHFSDKGAITQLIMRSVTSFLTGINFVRMRINGKYY